MFVPGISEISDLKGFLKSWEWRNLTLAEHLINRTKIKNLFGVSDTLLAQKQGTGRIIEGIVYISPQGLALPLFAKNSLPKRTIKQRLKPYFNKIRAFMGPMILVQELTEQINWPNKYQFSYYLMTMTQSVSKIDPPFSGLEILLAKPSDLEALLPLQQHYEQEEVAVFREKIDIRTCRRNLRQILKKQIVFSANHNGRPIAKVNTNACGINYCQIGGVFTLSQYRNQGIGRYLMSHLLLYLKKKSKNACLFVRKNNKTAIRLYSSLNFIHKEDFQIIYREL